MFESIGWGEIVVVALAALFIFGPERLPTVARNAATALKRMRRGISHAREQLGETLGDEIVHLGDLGLRRYHPKSFIHEQLFGDH